MILRTWCGSHIDSKEYTWKIWFLWIQGLLGLLPWNIKRTIQINLEQIIREKIRANVTCVNCRYWNFDSASGYNWKSFCGKMYWGISLKTVYEDDFRVKLGRARQCDDFELVSWDNEGKTYPAK